MTTATVGREQQKKNSIPVQTLTLSVTYCYEFNALNGLSWS